MLLACTKEEVKPSPYWGEVSILRNGQTWEPQVLASSEAEDLDSNFVGIIFHWYQPETGFLRESLSFRKTPLNRIGDTIEVDNSYFLELTGTIRGFYVTVLQSGDVAGDVYEVLESEENYLIVTSWDAEKREIKGEFQASFLFAGELHSTPDAPDTLRFSQGYFHTRIVN